MGWRTFRRYPTLRVRRNRRIVPVAVVRNDATSRRREHVTVAVYVTEPKRISSFSSLLWSTLYADTEDELHEFARCIGLTRHWFVSRSAWVFYHVTPGMRDRAISDGAIIVKRKRKRKKTVTQCRIDYAPQSRVGR